MTRNLHVSDACDDSLEGWCFANGLNDSQVEILTSKGFQSYKEVQNLNDETKQGLLDNLNFKPHLRDFFIQALSPDATELYAESTFLGTSIMDYRKARKTISAKTRTCCAPVASTTNMETQECQGLGGAEQTPSAAYRPGIHVVPHKVVVLDRKKSMSDNPTLTEDCFMSLRNDGLVLPDNKELKVILVVGETGSGKSTFINSLVNVLYQVKYDDPYRLKLITEPPTSDRMWESSSQTDQVIGYLLETAAPALNGHWVLIIDTPGFGVTRGAIRDAATVSEIKRFLETEIPYVHSVCFVVKGPDTGLTPTKRWIFDQILGLFGKDIKGIISMFMTFSDAKVPPALAVVDDAKIEYEKVFKLNNSGFFLPSEDTTQGANDFNAMFFTLGERALGSFLQFVCSSGARRLQETKAVLHRREQLQNSIENIRKYVNIGMTKLNDLEVTIDHVVRAKSLIEANKNFTSPKTQYRRVEKKKTTLYNTVCMECQWTCHEDCCIPNDADKMGCAAMSHGYCTACTKKCHWRNHKNLDYFWDAEEYQIVVTNEELKARYVSATSEKNVYEQIMAGLQNEFSETQDKVLSLVKDVKEMINELQRIALKPGTYHEDEYFDQMIEVEKKEAKRGWQDRVKMIASLKERSQFLPVDQLNRGNYDPFEERRKAPEKQARQGKVQNSIKQKNNNLQQTTSDEIDKHEENVEQSVLLMSLKEQQWDLTWPLWHLIQHDEQKAMAQKFGLKTIGEFEEFMSEQRALVVSARTTTTT